MRWYALECGAGVVSDALNLDKFGQIWTNLGSAMAQKCLEVAYDASDLLGAYLQM